MVMPFLLHYPIIHLKHTVTSLFIKALKDTNIQINIDLLHGLMQIRTEEVTDDFDFKADNLIPDY